MDVVSVVEAAAELEVSPRRVRQMLCDGVLSGRRVGREWVIERRVLDRVGRHRSHVGRPWRTGSAWALLAVADGDDSGLSPLDRSRARRRLAQRDLAGLVGQLSSRAQVRHFFGHPSVLGRLAEEPGVIRSGVSAAADYGADIVASDAFEAYVSEGQVEQLVSRYGLEADAERPNVLVRVVGDTDWPFAVDTKVAPRPVVAVDLLDADDDRTRRAGAELARSHP